MPEPVKRTPEQEALLAELKKVRESKTVKLKPSVLLKEEIVGLDGKSQPLNLRYYQVQAVYHFLKVRRMVLGDSTGTGKTLCAISALCHIWERFPQTKVLTFAPKSAVGQW